jgi:hypothetical protein
MKQQAIRLVNRCIGVNGGDFGHFLFRSLAFSIDKKGCGLASDDRQQSSVNAIVTVPVANRKRFF